MNADAPSPDAARRRDAFDARAASIFAVHAERHEQQQHAEHEPKFHATKWSRSRLPTTAVQHNAITGTKLPPTAIPAALEHATAIFTASELAICRWSEQPGGAVSAAEHATRTDALRLSATHEPSTSIFTLSFCDNIRFTVCFGELSATRELVKQPKGQPTPARYKGSSSRTCTALSHY